jgi:probable HAF family extracellular repeat protein
MKSNTLMRVTAMVLFALLATPVRLPAQEKPTPHYAVTDLGTLGGTFSVAVSVNNKSWITGDATLSDDAASRGFLRQHGANIDLGTLGGSNSRSQGVNQVGQVVGGAESSLIDPMNENFCFFGTASICLPFLWQDGAIAPLTTLGGSNGIAFDINSRGQIGGVAENSTPDSTCAGPEFSSEPVIWDNGNIRRLPTVLGDPDGFVQALNNKGQAVGGSGDCWTSFSSFSLHAVLWQNGSATNLGTLGGTLFSAASAINDQGQVMGTSDLPGDTNFFAGPFVNAHGFVWQHGVITDLGTLPGDSNSFAQSINNKGQVVGIGSRAIIWQNGVATDLNTLVPGPPFSPLYLLQANGINDRGEIVGFGLAASGETHAFLAIPCDETHADDAACNGGGFIAGTDLGSAAGVIEGPSALTRSNPALHARFGPMLNRPRVQRFPSRLGPNPGIAPVR